MSIMLIMLNLTVALLPIIQLSYTHDYLFWGDLPWLRVLHFMLPGAKHCGHAYLWLVPLYACLRIVSW